MYFTYSIITTMMKRKAYQLSRSKPFQYVVVWAIISCSVLLGVETFFHEPIPAFELLDAIFTIFFLAEILIRMVASGSLLKFFQICTFTSA